MNTLRDLVPAARLAGLSLKLASPILNGRRRTGLLTSDKSLIFTEQARSIWMLASRLNNVNKVSIMRLLRLSQDLFLFLMLYQNVQAAPEAPVTETGLIFADEGRYRSIPLATAPLLGNLPENVDMSGRFPEPGNQGHEGSCVGWAIAYGLKSFQEGEQRKWDLRNSAHLFSPAYIYNQIRQGLDCLGGCSYVDALDLLTSQGVATLADFPYSAGN